jgi:stage V sporulation protein D (sporulation-specific penicillin-binding protein)
LGANELYRYQDIFGFGQKTGVDLPGESAGVMFDPEKMGPLELATSSFGQGFNVTMTQMVASFASLINGGNYYKPHVVKQIRDESGNVLENISPVLVKKTISPETSKTLKDYMLLTMTEGTGKAAQVEGYTIGAKTGTAEKLPRGNGKHVLSYMGYAPADNPEVLVYVVIDEPNVEDQTVSSYVKDLSKAIMSEAFPYLNITKVQTNE